VLQALYSLSDDQAEFVIANRLSFIRFLWLGLGDRVPDAKAPDLIQGLAVPRASGEGPRHRQSVRRFDKHLTKSGYLAPLGGASLACRAMMGGQIVDATIVSAPRQHNTDEERRAIRAGEIPQEWQNKPAKLAQKDRDARWTVKYSKAKKPVDTPSSTAAKQHDIAIPLFGFKSHASIEQRYGFIRGWTATSASAHDGAQLRNVVQKDNTASTVWADTAYRSKSNEQWMEGNGLTSDIHQKKPKGKPMPQAMSKANARRSKVRAAVEHVFAQQKDKMKLFVRTIGIARATLKIGIANITYNMLRYVWQEGKPKAA
jgi:transposase, IS5 family